MLSILAVVLLGMTVIAVNRSSLQNGTILEQTQIGVYGISLASSIIEDASGKAFDEATVDNAVSLTSQLSSTLGPEGTEKRTPDTTKYFDDFDDYNGLNMKVGVAGVDSFTVQAKVYYVNDANPEVKVTGPTWYKRMDVVVFGTGVRDTSRAKRGLATGDTIKMAYVFSYLNY